MKLKARWRTEEWVEIRRTDRVKCFFFSGRYVRDNFDGHMQGEMAFERFADEKINAIYPGSRIVAVLVFYDRNGWSVQAENPAFEEIPRFELLDVIDVEATLGERDG